MVLASIAAFEPVMMFTVVLWHKVDLLFINSPAEVSVALVILITSWTDVFLHIKCVLNCPVSSGEVQPGSGRPLHVRQASPHWRDCSHQVWHHRWQGMFMFFYVIWPLRDILIWLWLFCNFWMISSRKPDGTQASFFLPHRWVLPSPWLTSRASLSCLWAQGRPTTTCAASTPALWSVPWWRLKWPHVLLLIHRHKRSQQNLLPRCREMFQPC